MPIVYVVVIAIALALIVGVVTHFVNSIQSEEERRVKDWKC